MVRHTATEFCMLIKLDYRKIFTDSTTPSPGQFFMTQLLACYLFAVTNLVLSVSLRVTLNRYSRSQKSLKQSSANRQPVLSIHCKIWGSEPNCWRIYKCSSSKAAGSDFLPVLQYMAEFSSRLLSQFIRLYTQRQTELAALRKTKLRASLEICRYWFVFTYL